jgi:hypothetical protein
VSDPAARLSSGMKVTEAVKLASAWWDETGRHIIDTKFNKRRMQGTVRAMGVSSGIHIRLSDIDIIPSGILRGKPWAELVNREQLQVIKIWHHFYVVLNETPPEDYPEQTKEMLGRLKLNS